MAACNVVVLVDDECKCHAENQQLCNSIQVYHPQEQIFNITRPKELDLIYPRQAIIICKGKSTIEPLILGVNLHFASFTQKNG
ncbi:hypothetical protein ERO13_D06G018950v2 [Gossypium hirsutum]|nr:hypothetical protein ERO13_D06G018950v2 [Gossypium hirsutum]